MDRAEETRRLRRITGNVDALAGDQWCLSADGEAMTIDVAGADGSRIPLLTFSRYARSDEIDLVAGALDHARLMLAVIGRAISASRGGLTSAHGERGFAAASAGAAVDGRASVDASARQPRNHAAEAAMLCQSPAFKRWLIDLHGLESPASDERAAQKLRSLLGVTSRRAINEDEAVRARWIALRRDFYAWKGRARV